MTSRRRDSYPARDRRFKDAGFGSYGKARRLATKLGLSGPDALFRPTSSRQLDRYPEAARDQYRQALRTIGVMKTMGWDLNQAAAFSGVSPTAVQLFGTGGTGAGPSRRALTQTAGGSWVPARADRMLRPMRAIEAGGAQVWVDVRGSHAASVLGGYWNAVNQFLSGDGDATALSQFAGVRVAGVEPETDPDRLEELGRQGVLSFESIYRETYQ